METEIFTYWHLLHEYDLNCGAFLQWYTEDVHKIIAMHHDTFYWDEKFLLYLYMRWSVTKIYVCSITGLSAGCGGDRCFPTHLRLVARHLLFSKILLLSHLFSLLANLFYSVNWSHSLHVLMNWRNVTWHHGNRRVNFISYPWLLLQILHHTCEWYNIFWNSIHVSISLKGLL